MNKDVKKTIKEAQQQLFYAIPIAQTLIEELESLSKPEIENKIALIRDGLIYSEAKLYRLISSNKGEDAVAADKDAVSYSISEIEKKMYDSIKNDVAEIDREDKDEAISLKEKDKKKAKKAKKAKKKSKKK